MKAMDLITSAMRLAGILAVGEEPDGAEAETGLSVLNDMLDSWSADRLMIFTVSRQVFTPAALKQMYTIGIGGDFNVPRPPRITRASIISLNNPAQPFESPIDVLTDAQWQAIPVKNTASALPTSVWPDGNFPLLGLNYFPVPNLAVQMALYTWTALSQFVDLLQTDYTFPPGYAKALRYNLAVELSPEFDNDLPPLVLAQATTSLAIVQEMNLPVRDLRCDPAIVPSDRKIYNYLTDNAGSR